MKNQKIKVPGNRNLIKAGQIYQKYQQNMKVSHLQGEPKTLCLQEIVQSQILQESTEYGISNKALSSGTRMVHQW